MRRTRLGPRKILIPILLISVAAAVLFTIPPIGASAFAEAFKSYFPMLIFVLIAVSLSLG